MINSESWLKTLPRQTFHASFLDFGCKFYRFSSALDMKWWMVTIFMPVIKNHWCVIIKTVCFSTKTFVTNTQLFLFESALSRWIYSFYPLEIHKHFSYSGWTYIFPLGSLFLWVVICCTTSSWFWSFANCSRFSNPLVRVVARFLSGNSTLQITQYKSLWHDSGSSAMTFSCSLKINLERKLI